MLPPSKARRGRDEPQRSQPMDSAPRPQHWRASAEQAAEIALGMSPSVPSPWIRHPRPQHWRASAEQAAEIALKGGAPARLPGTVGFLGSKSVRILLTRGDSHCYPCIATCATCSLKKEYLEFFKGNESYESQLHGCCRHVANKPGATLATICCSKRCQRHQTKTMAALFFHFWTHFS